MRRRALHSGTCVLFGVLLLVGWKLNVQVSTKKVAIPIGEKATECSFEVFDASKVRSSDITPGVRGLLSGLGIGLSKQKEGSPVRIECVSADSFPGWIDADGNLVSTLYGYSFQKQYPSGIPLLWYSGNSSKFRLLEKKGEEWLQSPGTFKDVTVPLPPGSTASSAIYSEFSSGSISEYSARLLRYVGIATSGNESRVRLKLGDYSGTGIVDARGKLRIIDETNWTKEDK